VRGGEVEFEGRRLSALDAEALRRVRGAGIGLVMQSARAALHPLLDVGTQIANVVLAHERMARPDALGDLEVDTLGEEDSVPLTDALDDGELEMHELRLPSPHTYDGVASGSTPMKRPGDRLDARPSAIVTGDKPPDVSAPMLAITPGTLADGGTYTSATYVTTLLVALQLTGPDTIPTLGEAPLAAEKTTLPTDDSTAALIEQFTADPQTSLFGTLSLWQGVDVPGPSCSLVIIDRIPFPRPDDPLLTARQRAVAARGGNGFMAVAAAHAALLLAQGAGRLLRRAEDRGVVAVLDSRMATARYGGYLRASMPPFWTTTDSGVVREALARLHAPPDA
jgi:hypothetical protein